MSTRACPRESGGDGCSLRAADGWPLAEAGVPDFRDDDRGAVVVAGEAITQRAKIRDVGVESR